MIVACSGCLLRYDMTGRKPGTAAYCRCGARIVVPSPGTEARALACPNCGARVAPDVTSCTYCSAVLATVSCPTCMGRVFTGAAHCEHCGAAIMVGATSAPDDGKTRRCPRCPPPSRKLTPRLLDHSLLEECHGCGGVWVDSTTFARIIREHDHAPLPAELVTFHTVVDGTAPPPSLGRHYIPCPECSDLMNQKNFGERSGVIIDFCKPHGFWFDQDELGRVVAFVNSGGLDEAHRRERARREAEAHPHAGEIAIAPAMTPHESGTGLADVIDAVRWMASFLK